MPGGRVLELGTGRRDTGLRLALEVFGAAHADGVERYEPSVAACRDAVRDLGGRVDVQPGDATALAAQDGAYDAVFGYHVLQSCTTPTPGGTSSGRRRGCCGPAGASTPAR